MTRISVLFSIDVQFAPISQQREISVAYIKRIDGQSGHWCGPQHVGGRLQADDLRAGLGIGCMAVIRFGVTKKDHEGTEGTDTRKIDEREKERASV